MAYFFGRSELQSYNYVEQDTKTVHGWFWPTSLASEYLCIKTLLTKETTSQCHINISSRSRNPRSIRPVKLIQNIFNAYIQLKMGQDLV